MNLTNTKLKWLREKGERVIRLTFRMRTIPLVSVILLGLIPSSYIFNLPIHMRWVYASAFSIFALASVPYINNIISPPILSLVRFTLTHKKHETHEYSTPEIETLAKRMGLLGKVKVYATSNPWIKGPFCNMITEKVFLPEKWTHPEQEPLATVSHEFGHLKNRRTLFFEMAFSQLVAIAILYVVFSNTIPSICKMVSIALQMLIFTALSWRNEDRADNEGARFAGPEGLISLFEKIKYESKWDDNSETHPSFEKRIKNLYKYMDQT